MYHEGILTTVIRIKGQRSLAPKPTTDSNPEPVQSNSYPHNQ